MFNSLSSLRTAAGIASFAWAIACGCSDSDGGKGDGGRSSEDGSSSPDSTTMAGRNGTSGNTGSGGRMPVAGSNAQDGGTDATGDSGTVILKPGTGGAAVALGGAADYAILAMSGVSTVPTSAVTGNLGVSPAAATYITGFSLIADSSNAFSRSTQVTGQVLAADHAVPTPAKLTKAVGDMLLAYTDASGRAPDVTELGAGNIGGMTLQSGVYKWGTGLLIPTDIMLNGSDSDRWIFQIAQDLTISSGAKVLLSGGALAKNVVWQVGGLANIGTTAHCEGVILAAKSVTLRTGASINGRLFAQTKVDIDGSTVVAAD